MPSLVTVANPLAGQNQPANTGMMIFEYGLDPALTAKVPLGTLMELEAYAPSPAITGDGSYNYPIIQPSSETADLLLVGVVVGGPSLGHSPYLPAGATGSPGGPVMAMVCVEGICQVLSSNTTTVGHALIQSTTVAGAAEDSGGTTATAGKTIGTVLQAVTISSGTALVWAYIHKT